MTDVEKGDEEKVAKQIIKDKEAVIKKLEDKLTEEIFLIACLQQENMKLKVNQMIQNKHIAYFKKEDVKGKSVVQLNVSEGEKEKSTPGRPRTRGFKRALELQKEVSPPRGQITVNGLITEEINVDIVYWIDKVNGHL